MATRRRDLARRHRVDAGDRAHGGPWSGDCLAGPSARRALVRRHSRASGISADVLSGLAAYGAISAFALSRVKATEPIRERQSAVLGFAEGTGVPVLGVPRTGMINFVLLDPSRPEVARLVGPVAWFATVRWAAHS